jgi:hypothetical protein
MKIKFEGTMAEWRVLTGGGVSLTMMSHPDAGLGDDAAAHRFHQTEVEATEEDIAFMARATEEAMMAQAEGQAMLKPPAAEPVKAKRRTKAEMEAARAAKLDGTAPPPEVTGIVEDGATNEPSGAEEAPVITLDMIKAKAAAAMLADRGRAQTTLQKYAKSLSTIPVESYAALMEELAWC